MKFPARNNIAFKQPQSFIVNYLIILKKNFKASASELTRVFYVQTQFQRKLFSVFDQYVTRGRAVRL